MNVGALRHRVEIQNFTVATNSDGQPIRTFSTLATVWAKVSPKSGAEFADQGIAKIQRTYDVIIRYTGDISESYRLVHNGVVLNIQSILNIDLRNRQMNLVCVESI